MCLKYNFASVEIVFNAMSIYSTPLKHESVAGAIRLYRKITVS